MRKYLLHWVGNCPDRGHKKYKKYFCKKYKKYFWWESENISSIELVTAQIGAAGTSVTTSHLSQFGQF